MVRQNPLTIDDIVSDIDFEVMQGIVSREDLGRALQSVRQHHNRVRAEALEAAGGKFDRQTLRWQFQLNDMLLTLLHEMIAAIRALQQRKGTSSLPQSAPPGAMTSHPILSPEADGPDERAKAYEQGYYLRPSTEVEAGMRAEALDLKLAVKSSKIPVVGRLITYFKQALFHQPALFYVERLAHKQVPINHTYGDWLLHLYRLSRHQREQIGLLAVQLDALQARVAELDERRSGE